MIRKMQNPDINRVADIWLKTNLKAHDFIPEQYWTTQLFALRLRTNLLQMQIVPKSGMIYKAFSLKLDNECFST